MDKPRIPPIEPVYVWNYRRLAIIAIGLTLFLGSAIYWLTNAQAESQPAVSPHLTALARSGVEAENKFYSQIKSEERLISLNKQRFWNSTYPFDGQDNYLLTGWYPKFCLENCLLEQDADVMPAWPVKPFKQAKPVISFLNDLRPASLHYGIDIAAPDKADIYAIQSGYAEIIESEGMEARVQVGDFIYWHLDITVQDGQWVDALKTPVGKVFDRFGHFHLSELKDGQYINPLRPGRIALPGWKDSLPPVIGDVEIAASGEAVVTAFDRQSLRQAKPYITPTTNLAALGYTLTKQGEQADLQQINYAFSGDSNYDFSLANSIYAMDEPPRQGSECYPRKMKCKFAWDYLLAGGLAAPLTASEYGDYTLTVYAWDWDNNLTAKDVAVTYSPDGFTVKQ